MSTGSENVRCEHLEQVCLHVVRALPASDAEALEAHIAACDECRQERERLRSLVDRFVSWPTDVLRPPASLWGRLAARIAADGGGEPLPEPARGWREPDWDEVAPGISVKLLASDPERHRVSMLVRLAPSTDYPPHRHAGVEELHLLSGVLVVNDLTLHPGDYIHAIAGTADAKVWSGTGCTCVLIISTQDELH